ncbi:pantetheine-phosphate adenylyltransferase [Bernardetia sp.]|uniref:pantetheine-phosphate adenylyltransferase n=1 Tax=Bernardetia sp. TaxID=1937974 RepID=UPI0025C02C55|nr:pantetheine-phosphate adenylyltransferase [Bernardetia sp.]
MEDNTQHIPRIAIFPGSFDPFTKGHEDVVRRGLHLFDKIIISIGFNSQKKRFFELETMEKMIQETFKDEDRIEVQTYSELTALFAKRNGARFILRGIRNTTDFEYETPISQANKHVDSDIETVFLITSPQYTFISSSIVRELYRYGQDVSKFVPYQLPVISNQ